MSRPGPTEETFINAEGEEETVLLCGEVDATDADPRDWRLTPQNLERVRDKVEDLRRRYDGLKAENARYRQMLDQARHDLREERLARLKLEKHSRAQSIELLAYHRDDVWRRMVSELPEDFTVADIVNDR